MKENTSNQHTFLTYNTWEGEIHKGVSLNINGLNETEIQIAIDGYRQTKDNLEREVLRLNSLIDNLLNENNNYKRILDKYHEVDSGY